MPRRCELDGCDNPYLARGMCNKHYLRWKTRGGKTRPRPALWSPEEDRLLLAAGLTPHTERWSGESRLRDVARELGRTETACCTRLNRLMKRAGHAGGQWTVEGLWTPEEDAVILEQAASGQPDWIATGRLLGRTRAACAVRAYNLRKQERLAS